MDKNNKNKDRRSSKLSSSIRFSAYNPENQNKGYTYRPRELHDAKCSECKKDCQVPFKPTSGKPIFCRDCYAKKKKVW